MLVTLEEAGFCGRGEGGRFVDEHDLRWNGDFPLNTHGGQLSFGQPGLAGGMSHVTEAVRQVQQRGGDRQVRGLELAFVNGNGGIMSRGVRTRAGGAGVSATGAPGAATATDLHRPRPTPSPLTQPFWEATGRHQFLLQRCRRAAAPRSSTRRADVPDVRLGRPRLGGGLRAGHGAHVHHPPPADAPRLRQRAEP